MQAGRPCRYCCRVRRTAGQCQLGMARGLPLGACLGCLHQNSWADGARSTVWCLETAHMLAQVMVFYAVLRTCVGLVAI